MVDGLHIISLDQTVCRSNTAIINTSDEKRESRRNTNSVKYNINQ